MSEYFGVCPNIGTCDGYVNIGPDHWFYSNEGKTKWCAGSNVFSTWRHEDPSVWEANRLMLADFVQVEPRESAA